MDPGDLLLIHDEETQESSDLRQAIYLSLLLKGRPLCLYGFIVIYNPISRDNYLSCFAVMNKQVSPNHRKKNQSEKPTHFCTQK